jgi:hypothetical protein
VFFRKLLRCSGFLFIVQSLSAYTLYVLGGTKFIKIALSKPTQRRIILHFCDKRRGITSYPVHLSKMPTAC